MTAVTFQCPTTRDYVQQWIDEDSRAEENSFAVVNCPACGKLHFVNRSTRKLLGHERE